MSFVSPSVVLVSGPDAVQAGWTYYLYGKPPAQALDADAPWLSASGVLLFSNGKIDPAAAEAVAAGLLNALGAPVAPPRPWRMVAWLDDPAAPPKTLDALYASEYANGLFAVRRPWSARFGALSVTLGSGLGLRFAPADGAPAAHVFAHPRDVGRVAFYLRGERIRIGYSRDGFDIPIRIAGAGAGGLRIAAGVDPAALIEALRCGFLYATPQGRVAASMVRPIPRTVDNFRAFDIRLHPARPFDDVCTRFSVDDHGRLSRPGFDARARTPDPLLAPYFCTVEGEPASLRPYDPGPDEPEAMAGGFAFSRRPVDGEPYLSPCGLWAPVDPPPVLRLMCGMFGGEYLRLRPGDHLFFRSHRPAAVAGPGAAAPLDDAATTSWAVVRPGASPPPAYFAEPSASSFFGARPQEPFPQALDVQVATFAAASPPFPMLPYGGIYVTSPADLHTQHPAPSAGTLKSLLQFEASILAHVRHDVLTRASLGPVLLRPGGDAPDRATTPQGLLVALDASGMMTNLTLAQSPAYPGIPTLALGFSAASGATLPPSIANALTRDQAFLVVSTLPQDMNGATFHNRLDLAGFNLVFDVGKTGGAILVFKFNTRANLRSLAADPSLWTDAAAFNADPPAATAKRLGRCLDAAQAPAGAADSFAAFNALADDEAWTGVLAFDVAVDGAGMPPGLQILLGGVDGVLRAHHIGLETNRIETGAGEPSLKFVESALFGVIHYQAPSPAPPPASFPDYRVEHLRVAWSNSRVVQSDVAVGVTFSTLFGREVWLRATSDEAPPNTLSIAGVSQTVDGVDVVTFDTSAPFVFDFRQTPAGADDPVRVLERLQVDRARLAPVRSEQEKPDPAAQGKQAPATDVALHLLMDGQLLFAKKPFAAVADIDLFSYGSDAGEGMAFSGLAVEIAFKLDGEQGALVPGSKTVKLREDLLIPNPKPTSLRPGSLLASFPAQVSGFVAAPQGVPDAAPLHIVELEPKTVDGARPPPCTTQAPVWALEYDIHLGSLGALSDDHAGLAAKLFVGWGPAPSAPDSDAAGLMVALPHLSGGIAGFSLQGLLKTKFDDGNLMRVDLPEGSVYAISFGNVRLSFFGIDFPPRTMTDFTVFAGGAPGANRKSANLAWFLAARQTAAKS